MNEEPKSEGCGFHEPYFGAAYPDATCINGYLWDLDSADGDYLTSGGDDPCPQCNRASFLENAKENAVDEGALAFSEGLPREFPRKGAKLISQLPEEEGLIEKWWLEGWDEASKNTETL